MRILRNREVPDFEAKAAKPSRKKIKHEVEPNINNLPELPDEILVKIMTYLSWKDLLEVAALVCKQWKRLTEDPELWRCIVLDRSPEIPIGLLVHLVEKFDSIRTIDLSGGYHIETTEMRQIGRQIGRQLMLRTLKMDDSFTVLSLTNIKSISNCRWLECLYLLNFERLNDVALTMIAKSCTKLITLELKYCHKITSKSLKAVVVNCTGLKHLTLNGCSSVTSDAFLDCNLDIQLETLDISNGSDETFDLNFVHKLSKLKVLHANWNGKMNDAVVSNLHNLTVLNVDGSPLTSEGFLAILRNNPSLQKLKVYRTPIYDSDLAMISRSLCRSTLTHLTFDWLGSVTDSGIDNVLQNCSQLRKLYAYLPDYRRAETKQMARWRREFPGIKFRFYLSLHMQLIT